MGVFVAWYLLDWLVVSGDGEQFVYKELRGTLVMV